MVDLPLFPLPVVLFPGTRLPLQIFEPRYLRMVKEAMKNESGFVMVQSLPGKTKSEPSQPFCSVGCYGEIADWHPLPNDLLGIELDGLHKVMIHTHRAEADGLLIGQCEYLAADQQTNVAEKHQALVQLLKDLQKHPMIEMIGLEIDYRNATEVGYKLAEFLPFSPAEKQLLLESDDALLRLDAIQSLLQQLGGK